MKYAKTWVKAFKVLCLTNRDFVVLGSQTEEWLRQQHLHDWRCFAHKVNIKDKYWSDKTVCASSSKSAQKCSKLYTCLS